MSAIPLGMNSHPSGPFSHNLVAYFQDVNLYEVPLRCSGIKGYCFALGALYTAVGGVVITGMCTGIRQNVI